MTLHKHGDDTSALLADVAFFDGLSSQDLERVAELCDEVAARAGSVVVDQGDPGTACYVLVSGTASVYVSGEHVASLSPGTMIGEMSLVDHRPRTATVVADSDLALLRFDSKAFAKLLEEMPKASERLMAILQARLGTQ